jgi:hypothetical protein
LHVLAVTFIDEALLMRHRSTYEFFIKPEYGGKKGKFIDILTPPGLLEGI